MNPDSSDATILHRPSNYFEADQRYQRTFRGRKYTQWRDVPSPILAAGMNAHLQKVHADASNFAQGITKDEAYEQVLLQAEGLFYGQRNWVCNLANAASLLWHAYKSLPAPSKDVNWAGFYVADPSTREQLILGPFQGKVACQTIVFGRGVCGAAAATKATQLVRDVEAFPGHIACDGDSKSEIVVPVIVSDDGVNRVVAIIDVDCAALDGFDEVDQKYLERLAALLASSCDW